MASIIFESEELNEKVFIWASVMIAISMQAYSPEEVADAAVSGIEPWEWGYVSKDWVDSQLEDEPEDDAFSVETNEPFQSTEGFPLSVLEQT